MRTFRPARALKIVVLVAAAIAVAGLIAMALWNWLLPPLFGWHRLTFVQAVGLMVLCRLFFGGFRGAHRPFTQGKFRALSPEERERFREEMRARWGRGGPAPRTSAAAESRGPDLGTHQGE